MSFRVHLELAFGRNICISSARHTHVAFDTSSEMAEDGYRFQLAIMCCSSLHMLLSNFCYNKDDSTLTSTHRSYEAQASPTGRHGGLLIPTLEPVFHILSPIMIHMWEEASEAGWCIPVAESAGALARNRLRCCGFKWSAGGRARCRKSRGGGPAVGRALSGGAI